jgi:hypothetical protein
VGVRGDPFQLTTESLVNPVPFTTSEKPLVFPQNGAEAGDRDVIDGGFPGAAPIEKMTMLDTSVVVVLLTLDVPEVAEPGIWTAICTVPAVVRSEAGTGAVN